MSIYGVTGVKLNDAGEVVQAAIGQIDPARNAWIYEPKLLDAPDLANLAVRGDTIYALFELDGERVHGPKFRHVVFPGGRESIALEEDIPGRRITDLVQIAD